MSPSRHQCMRTKENPFCCPYIRTSIALLAPRNVFLIILWHSCCWVSDSSGILTFFFRKTFCDRKYAKENNLCHMWHKLHFPSLFFLTWDLFSVPKVISSFLSLMLLSCLFLKYISNLYLEPDESDINLGSSAVTWHWFFFRMPFSVFVKGQHFLDIFGYTLI